MMGHHFFFVATAQLRVLLYTAQTQIDLSQLTAFVTAGPELESKLQSMPRAVRIAGLYHPNVRFFWTLTRLWM
jgi:hypothetical protein